MIERHRPLSSAERAHVKRALELARPTSRLVLLVVCLGAVPYLFVLISSGPLSRLGLDFRIAVVLTAAAGLLLGLALLRRGMDVRAKEMAVHRKRLERLEAALVRELKLDVDEYWIVEDIFEEVRHGYLLRSNASYVLLVPNRSSFVPHAEVEIDVIEPLGLVLRNESAGGVVPKRGSLPYVEDLSALSDCRVLTAEELPEAWRARVAA